MAVFNFLLRLLLVLINLILVLVSLALLVFALIVKFAPQVITSRVLQTIESSAEKVFPGLDLDTAKFNLEDIFGGVTTALVAISFVIFSISLLGCCGALYKEKNMLTAYSTMLILLVVAQVVIVIVVFGFSSILRGKLKEPMKTWLNEYQGLNGTNLESLAWNFVMQEFDCCGLENYTDFKSGNTQWFGENDTNWMTPLACCKTLPTDTDVSCAQNLDSTVNNYDIGCYETLWDQLMAYKTYAYIASGLIIGFQVLMIVFAMVLCCKKNEKKVN